MQGVRTYTCFIDIKKAYDTVWHEGLKLKLLEYGITGAMYRAICGLYAGCESTIRLSSGGGGAHAVYTDFFPIETGVRQGCILSPLLYSLFINDLAKSLRSSLGTGDEVELHLSKEGRDSHQAVGYLPDGTMIVVNNGREFIGQTLPVTVSGTVLTSAGRLIFAEVRNGRV